MIIVDSEEDFQMKGQSKKLYDALKSLKSFIHFSIEDGASEHCQVGGYLISNERIFDWLVETL